MFIGGGDCLFGFVMGFLSDVIVVWGCWFWVIVVNCLIVFYFDCMNWWFFWWCGGWECWFVKWNKRSLRVGVLFYVMENIIFIFFSIYLIFRSLFLLFIFSCRYYCEFGFEDYFGNICKIIFLFFLKFRFRVLFLIIVL